MSRRRIDAVPIVPTRVRSRRRRRFRVVRLQHPLGRPEFDRILPLHPRRFVQRLRPDASRDYEFVLDRRRRAHVRVDQRRRGLALDVVSKAQQRGVGVDVVGARDGARDGVDRDRDDRDFDGARAEARASTAAHRARTCTESIESCGGVEYFQTKTRAELRFQSSCYNSESTMGAKAARASAMTRFKSCGAPAMSLAKARTRNGAAASR